MKRSSIFALVLLVGGVNTVGQKPFKAETLENSKIVEAQNYAHAAGEIIFDNNAWYTYTAGTELKNFSWSNLNALTNNLQLIQAEHDRINTLDTTSTSHGNDITTNASGISSNDTDISTNASGISTNTAGISTNTASIESLESGGGVIELANGKMQLGKNNAMILIEKDGNGISHQNGKNLIKRDSNGVVSIGENSLKTAEVDGIQKLYATDASGDAIPINITEGSDLQINGVSVQGQITDNARGVATNSKAILNNTKGVATNSKAILNNTEGVATNSKAILNNSSAILSNRKAIDSVQDNVNDLGFGVAGATALSTAMSSLPTVAQDSPLSCGVGTGGYSSRFAMSVGCAVKASSRLSINAGGSYVFGGGADYGNGSLSSAAARAGFVFKLGNLQQPEGGNNEQLQSQLDEVKEENKALLARLERLEAIALGNQSSTTSVGLK